MTHKTPDLAMFISPGYQLRNGHANAEVIWKRFADEICRLNVAIDALEDENTSLKGDISAMRAPAQRVEDRLSDRIALQGREIALFHAYAAGDVVQAVHTAMERYSDFDSHVQHLLSIAASQQRVDPE